MKDIQIIFGDIRDCPERTLIAHGVNCKGVMGSGVAKALRDKWPSIFDPYKAEGDRHQWDPQKLLGRVNIVSAEPILDIWVANCFTQATYGSDRKVRYADIDAVKTALSRCMKFCQDFGLNLALPKIGSDRGGLSWENEVYPFIQELNNEYASVHITVYIYEE